jgi:protein O-mannosyl-transferase
LAEENVGRNGAAGNAILEPMKRRDKSKSAQKGSAGSPGKNTPAGDGRFTPSARSPETRRASASTARAFELKDWLFLVALLAAVVLVYQPAWHGGLLLDDDVHISGNPRSWHGLYRIWFDLAATQQYYPLSETAFWAQYKLWGEVALGYHLFNIVLHGLAAVMVALVLRRLAIPGAYLAAAIFALHPVHVESVAWIAEQKNTLSAVFYLAAAMAYLRFDESRGWGWYGGALTLFVLSLLSKIVTVTLPAALLVIFWWQRGKLSWRRDVTPLSPFFTIGAVAGVFLAWLERTSAGAQGSDFAMTIMQRCLLPGRVVWFYLGKLFWPGHLLLVYPRWEVDPTVWWQYLFPVALATLLAVLWWMRRRWRGPLAGMLFFAGTLFPVLGFLNVYWFIFSFVADHLQYLASLGIITLAAAGAALWLDRRRLWRRPGGYAACLLLLAILASLTWRQSRMYAGAESLYRTTIAENPRCWMAYNNLGTALANRGLFVEAAAECRKALEIKPDYAEAHNNLGVALAACGQSDDAIAHLQKALQIKPGYTDAHNNLGNALAECRRVDEAIAHYEKALEANPDHASARNNLGIAQSQREAIRHTLLEKRESLRSHPKDVGLLNDTAWMLATNPNASIRNGAEAVELAQRAAQLSGGREPAILGTLAAAYAEAGRFPDAVQTARKAVELATQQDKLPFAESVTAKIPLYQSQTPYREMQRLATPHSDHR